MIEALLEGKLSEEQENMEDVLTSMVFGAFRREKAASGLLPFICLAEPCEGSIPLPNEYIHCTAKYDDYEFWPRWPTYGNVAACEPDLVIEINIPNSKNILLLIEVKYQSGKSSEASTQELIMDQLAKEWLHLCKRAETCECMPWLIYLTADIACPRKDIENAIKEINEKGPKGDKSLKLDISWLSWRCLSELFDSDSDDSASTALKDISKLVRYLGLNYYKGVSGHSSLPESYFRFDRPFTNFQWQYAPIPLTHWMYSNE